MIPELETLEQILDDDLPLSIVRGFFDDGRRFRCAIAAMLDAGEVRLLTEDGAEVPCWRWREVLGEGANLQSSETTRLGITALGVKKVSGG